MKKRIITTTIIILLFLFLTINTKAIINISSCGDVINITGETYNLTNNLTGAKCLVLDADNIIFEGNNNYIYGNGSGWDYALKVNKTNITIRNLNLSSISNVVLEVRGDDLKVYNSNITLMYGGSYNSYGILSYNTNGYFENVNIFTTRTNYNEFRNGFFTNRAGNKNTFNNTNISVLGTGIYSYQNSYVYNSDIYNNINGFEYIKTKLYLNNSNIFNNTNGVVLTEFDDVERYASQVYEGYFYNNTYDFKQGITGDANRPAYIYYSIFNHSKIYVDNGNYLKYYTYANFYFKDLKNVSIRNTQKTNTNFYLKDLSGNTIYSSIGFENGIILNVSLSFSKINNSGEYPYSYNWTENNLPAYNTYPYIFNVSKNNYKYFTTKKENFGSSFCINFNEENTTYNFTGTNLDDLKTIDYYCNYINASNITFIFNDHKPTGNSFQDYSFRVFDNVIPFLINNSNNITFKYLYMTNNNGTNKTGFKIYNSKNITINESLIEENINYSIFLDENSSLKLFNTNFKNVIGKGFVESFKALYLGLKHDIYYLNLSYNISSFLDDKKYSGFSNNVAVKIINFLHYKHYNNTDYYSINNILNTTYLEKFYNLKFNYTNNNSVDYDFISFDFNFVPVVNNITIKPSLVNFTLNNVSCVFNSSDKDNDTLTTSIFWFVNGNLDDNLTNQSIILLNTSYFNVYDNLSCKLNVSDYRSEANYTSNNPTINFTINNTKPIINEFYISYNNITDEYVCNLNYTDYDDDTSVVFEMWVDNTSMGQVNKISNPVNFTNIKCQANISDTDSIIIETTYLYGDIYPPTAYFTGNPTSATIVDKVFIKAYCKDNEGSLGYGYPKASWINPNGIVEGNFTLNPIGNNYYGRYYTFSIVGDYTNFTLYCKDGNGNLAVDNSTFKKLSVSYPNTDGGGGGTTIINEDNQKLKFLIESFYLKVFYNVKKEYSFVVENDGYQDAFLNLKIDTANSDSSIIPYVYFKNSSSESLNLLIPKSKGLSSGTNSFTLVFNIPNNVKEGDYDLIINYKDSFGNEGKLNFKVGVYKTDYENLNKNIIIIGASIFLSLIIFLIIKKLKIK